MNLNASRRIFLSFFITVPRKNGQIYGKSGYSLLWMISLLQSAQKGAARAQVRVDTAILPRPSLSS